MAGGVRADSIHPLFHLESWRPNLPFQRSSNFSSNYNKQFLKIQTLNKDSPRARSNTPRVREPSSPLKSVGSGSGPTGSSRCMGDLITRDDSLSNAVCFTKESQKWSICAPEINPYSYGERRESAPMNNYISSSLGRIKPSLMNAYSCE